jgi:FkbM family methyltransferase
LKLQLARAQALLNQQRPKTDEAMKILQPLVNKKNAPWPVYHYAGIAFLQKGEYGTALSFLIEAVRQGGDQPETFHSISMCHFNLGEYAKAEEYSDIALKKNPEFFKAWLHLGAVYRAQAKLDEALKCFQKANQIDPKSAGVAYRIGEIYNDQGDLNKALELFDITIKVDEEYISAYLAKAEILKKQREFEEAEKVIQTALGIEPRNVGAQVSLGELYKHEGRYDDAIELYEKLIQSHPKVAGIRVNYALCMQELGQFDESEKNYLKAFEDQPDTFESLSNYLMGLHYNPVRSKEEIFEKHKLWDQNFAPKKRPNRPVPVNTDIDKKLRIGFISGGFRTHPVGWMITSALENLPKDQFEIYCYTTNNRYDRITKRIHAVTDKWQSVIGYNDEIISKMIKDDEIDILIELSGHSADTRLKTVAMEPAPVIVKWVGGLFNTTGMASVDFLISDHQETPNGEEKYYTEKLVRMPDDYICFLPPEYAPDVAELPAKENGYITFGCFNNPTKVNDSILEKWAEVMNRVSESRLFLKSKQYDTPALRERIIDTMEKCGISSDRILFEGQSPHDELLECYNLVDIALDPWPYSGGLTTCEALWMGVPVVTKPGPTFAGRHSTTHLYNAGFPDWITATWDEYSDKVVELASDIEALAEIRSGIRNKVAASPICDGERFGMHLSKAFREMWKQRVEGYNQKLPEGEWQDHIEIEAVAEDEIQRKDTNQKTDRINSDFMSNEIGEAAKQAKVETNGNGHHTNGSVKKVTGEKPDVYKIKTMDGVTICTPADLTMMTPYVLFEQNTWYENEMDFIRTYLKAGMNVVDVGAGFGVYSLPATRLVGNEGTVFSFEPGSISKKHLEMSKLENGFENLEVIGKAVTDSPGRQSWKEAETPELNKLDENSDEKVACVTLDSWWQFEGEPNVDLIKIDINGNEAEALSGAKNLLESENPLILIAITEKKSDILNSQLSDLGYKLYEYIPGPGILAEHDAEAGVDPYFQNLIAVHDSQLNELKKDGWLHDESVTPQEVSSGLWKIELARLPWVSDLMEQWENHGDTEGINLYLIALNNLIAAEQIDIQNSDLEQPRSQKANLLIRAAQILIDLYNQGANSTSVVFTLVRTLNALGKRGQAVEVMRRLIESTKLGRENMNVDLPFMLPIPEQDNAPIKTDLSKWLMVRTVEGWILLKDVSSYFSGEQDRKLIEVLKGNPEVCIDRFHQNGHNNQKITFTQELENKLNLPSKVINANVDDFSILIPRNELFRLKNIFSENEYSLPSNYDIDEDSVIVDIGGNVGAFSLYAARWSQDAEIYSFEPNPQVFPLLEINTQNFKNIHSYFYGLGEKNEMLTLYQNPNNTGASSTSTNYIGSTKVEIEIRSAIQVLNELNIKKIDVLKIDTEGAEVPILKSLEPMFSKIGVIMLEYHSLNDRELILNMLDDFEFYSKEKRLSNGVGTIKCINKSINQKSLA